MMSATIKELTLESGELMSYAFPGGYPLVYYTHDNIWICPACATIRQNDPDEFESWKPAGADIHYEGQPIICEDCNIEIESAYGDPSEDQ